MSYRPRPPQWEDPAEGMLDSDPEPYDWAEQPSEFWLGLVVVVGFSGFLVGAALVGLVWWLS